MKKISIAVCIAVLSFFSADYVSARVGDIRGKGPTARTAQRKLPDATAESKQLTTETAQQKISNYEFVLSKAWPILSKNVGLKNVD